MGHIIYQRPEPDWPRASLAASLDADDGEIAVHGVGLVADLAGALFWPEEGLLAVSDLHLEKGSSFATRGVLVPPYDTAATLERLADLIGRYQVRMVVALGDNFHDGGGPARIASGDRARLLGLQRGRDWVWITGNHDPAPRGGIGGIFVRSLALGRLFFQHELSAQHEAGGIGGHLHPCARVRRRGRTLTRRCFAGDGAHLIMPAFGAYTGGLNIRDTAFVRLFGALAFTAYLIGGRRLYAFAAARCVADGS